MFNPQPQIQAVPLHEGHACLVVDDALQVPEQWRLWAGGQRSQLVASGLAYPGLEHWLPPEPVARIVDFFSQHLRTRLGMRRVVQASARLSLVNQAPQTLKPMQWQCHRDGRGLADDEGLVAGVLYLFDDPALGGTSFYRPRRDAAQTEALVRDGMQLDAAAFSQRYPEVAPGYQIDSNAWFERVASVPAAFNRAIFYDGGLFHSGDIRHPERLSDDPAIGRLTLNTFIRCRRQAR